MKRVLVLLIVVGAIKGHLLPQALEDVHAFVQSELQQRSRGDQRQLNIEAPPSGGPMFQTTQTQTYIGIPVVLQKDVKFDGGGRVQKSNEDLNTAQLQNIVQQHRHGQAGGDSLPRGLIPPIPMDQQSLPTSNDQPQVIPAELVGPSTFVSDAPKQNNYRQVRVPPQLVSTGGSNGGDQDRRTIIDNWVPLDSDGTRLAKGVGVKLQVGEESEKEQDTAYKGTGYSNAAQDSSKTEARNELEILQTNSVKLQDIIIGKNSPNLQEDKGRFPIYPGGRSPKVVIHAQNVIIRDGSETEVNSKNGTIPGNIKQFPAYSAVPQLNNFLRDQLKIAAMNQIMQQQLRPHPLNDVPFPRPLSLREIALAVRSGQFPEPPIENPLLSQARQMQINIPHMVNMNPDAAHSIQTQTKLPYPGGIGLGNLYRNILQQGPPPSSVGGPGFDPREPLEYSLLAALSGQRVKAPRIPTFKSRPHISHDYGDSVAYTIGKDGDNKPPIQIVPTEPQQSAPDALNPGSLRGVSEQLLKQMILQELQEIQDTPNVLLPSGIHSNPARLPLRNLKPSLGRPSYGTNAHPFAYLGEDDSTGGVPDAVFEETYEYSLPPGVTVEDYMNDDGKNFGYKKRPSHIRYSPPGYPVSGDGDIGPDADGALPLNRDTLVQLGKGLFHQALDFSRHHNPMTLFSKIRSLPPVKVDLYKVPMGIPDSMMAKLPETWRSEGGGSRSGGRSGRGGRGEKRGRRKNLPRKNGSKYRN